MVDIQYSITIMGGREVSRPYRFFSPKASGFYPFGDATDLAGEGGIGDVVWLIHASAWNQTYHSTNDKCEALASPKGCLLCFCFSPPVFPHWANLSLQKGNFLQIFPFIWETFAIFVAK